MSDFSNYRGEAPRNFKEGPPPAVPRLESISSENLNLPPTTERMSPTEIASREAASLLDKSKANNVLQFSKTELPRENIKKNLDELTKGFEAALKIGLNPNTIMDLALNGVRELGYNWKPEDKEQHLQTLREELEKNNVTDDIMALCKESPGLSESIARTIATCVKNTGEQILGLEQAS